jgi:glycosyltransferase involved in cell wall biosynthesis
MPGYNAAESLAVAVSSVLKQSIRNLEIIIVDDASTDTTPALVAALAETDGRIVSIRLPHNSGPAAARNIGLDAARGTWIAPVDADDEISHDRLRVLSDAGGAQSADVIADGVVFVGHCWEGQSFELPASSATRDELSIEDLVRSDIPLNRKCSLGYLKPLMRRDFLQRFGLRYDEALWFAEDFNLYAQALLCGARFVLHPESHYYYNQTPLSASRCQDTLPDLAGYALLGNQKLREFPGASSWPGLDPLLVTHRLRWSTVLWFNQMKRALRDRRLRDASKLWRECPGGSLNMLAFMSDRIRASWDQAKTQPSMATTIGKSVECP